MGKLLPGLNDLATLYPSLAERWDFDLNSTGPDQVTAGSSQKAWWKCNLGHSYEAIIYSQKSSGCPVCSGKRVLTGFNDLATRRPELLSEWDYEQNSVDPSQISVGSSLRVRWICKIDSRHVWESKLSNRGHLGRGCPVCANSLVIAGVNDLSTTHPQIAGSWDFERNTKTPQEVVGGSNQAFWWICPKLHHYLAKPAERTGKGTDCAVCENRQIEKGVNDLATTHPELVKEIDFDVHPDLDPATITAGFGKHLNWKCSEGHKWRATVINRSRTGMRKSGVPITGTGCPVCKKEGTGKRASDVYNLTTSHPELAKQWDQRKNSRPPESYTKGVTERVHWVCGDGHEWAASIVNRTYFDQGCPVCSNQRTLEGENDLRTLFPQLALEWHPTKNKLQPTEIQPGSPTNYWWLCQEKHAFRASPVNRTRGGTGCPSCAQSGFDPTEKGYLYLLSKPEMSLQQFGITNFPEKRLRTHRSKGWEVLDVYGPSDGYWIADVELAIKHFFRDNGALLTRTYPDKFDGYSESWTSISIQYESISKLLDDLRIWEELARKNRPL